MSFSGGYLWLGEIYIDRLCNYNCEVIGVS